MDGFSFGGCKLQSRVWAGLAPFEGFQPLLGLQMAIFSPFLPCACQTSSIIKVDLERQHTSLTGTLVSSMSPYPRGDIPYYSGLFYPDTLSFTLSLKLSTQSSLLSFQPCLPIPKNPQSGSDSVSSHLCISHQSCLTLCDLLDCSP